MCNSINTPIIRGVVTSDDFGVLRLVFIEDEVLFCGRDVARAMGFADPRKSVSDCCKRLNRVLHDTPSGKQFLNFIDFHDALRLFRHSRTDDACDYVIFLKDMKEAFKAKIALMTEQEETAETMSCEVDANDTETEKALDNFIEMIKELHEKYGIFVSLEGIYLDEGDERYRLV